MVAKKKRRPLDQYFTPPGVVRAFLPHVEPYLRAGLVLEPACGDGAIAAEVVAAGGRVLAVDIDPRCVAKARARLPGQHVLVRDFLAFGAELRATGVQPSLVLGNPPYGQKQAERFVRHALDLVAPDGAVAMLLRLGFLETRERAPFIAANLPDIHVLAERPSFTGDGGTDGTGYMWAVWPKSRPAGEPGQVRLLSWDGALDGGVS